MTCIFRILPQITHQTPFNSDYFSINYMLYINCCLSKKAHIIAILSVASMRHLIEINMKSINLVIIFALILHCFLSSILKLASLVGWCLSLESGRTDFSVLRLWVQFPLWSQRIFLLESYDQIFISFCY